MNTLKLGSSPQNAARLGLATLCFITQLAMATTGFAQQPTPKDNNLVEVHFGAHSWPALADLQSSFGGRFDSSGFNLGLGMYWGDRVSDRFLWGVDLSLFYTEGNIRSESKSLVARGLYLVPSVKIPVDHSRRFYLDAGLGIYMVDFAELGCVESDACFGDNEAWQSIQPGGYLGASMGLPIGKSGIDFTLALRVHYANFGTPNGLGPSPGELNGPIYMLQIGIGM